MRPSSGQVLVYRASPESFALVELARNLIADPFGPKDPETALYDMLAEDFSTRESRHPLAPSCTGASSGRIWHG